MISFACLDLTSRNTSLNVHFDQYIGSGWSVTCGNNIYISSNVNWSRSVIFASGLRTRRHGFCKPNCWALLYRLNDETMSSCDVFRMGCLTRFTTCRFARGTSPLLLKSRCLAFNHIYEVPNVWPLIYDNNIDALYGLHWRINRRRTQTACF